MGFHGGTINVMVKDVNSTWHDAWTPYSLLTVYIYTVFTPFAFSRLRHWRSEGRESSGIRECIIHYSSHCDESCICGGNPYMDFRFTLRSLWVLQVNVFNGKNMASTVNFTGLQVRTVHVPAVRNV